MRALLASNSNRYPDALAFRDVTNQVTWREANDRIQRVVGHWQSAGERSGQRVALFLEQHVDAILTLLAALCAGDQIALLDPRMSEAEWQRVEQALQPDKVLGSTAVFNRLSLADRGQTFSQTMEEAHAGDLLTAPKEAERVGSLLFLTSGSTGQPKFVERFVPALRSEGISYVKTLGLTERDVFFGGLPLFHSYAFGCVLLAALECGGCVVVPSLFYAPKAVRWIQQHRVTFLPLVPSLVRSMVDAFQEPTPCPSLRYVMVGTGQTSPELAAEFQRLFGIELSGNYGSTETGGLISRLQSMEQEKGATGRAMIGTEVLVADESGQPVPAGTTGQILIKTEALFSGYLGQAAPTASELDGWWKIGDLGHQDDEGRLFVTGRLSNVLQRNGKKISAEHLESALLQLNGIVEAAVVGERNADTQEDVLIAVVVTATDAELDATTVRMHCFETAGRYAAPDEVVFVKELPRSANGKLLRSEVLNRVRLESGGALR